MKIVTERSRSNLKTAVAMTMGAALNLSGAESPELNDVSEAFASLALEVWPDITPRDLVTLGIGAKYAYAVLTEDMDADDGVEAFADMVNSLRATVEHVEDEFGIDLSGRTVLRLCAGGGE
ncbi:hypothetical protein ACTQ1Z_03530 [Parolsenella sp. LCP21S3_E11]|uniref:hypothetical protein n=1 Tax=Parolsenella sp. LCP21S3_E11 TaxID=3438797 RepID=UPI003F9C841F